MSAVRETLTSRVLELGRTAPDAPALRTDDRDAVTYASLARDVLRSAAALSAIGARPGARVLIDARRSEAYVVQLLACWHLGASAVPLAEGLAPSTEAKMLARLGPTVDARGARLASDAEDDGAPIQPAAVGASDEAYVFFTSGSSGTPKGVSIGHGGLPHLFAHQGDAFRISRSSRTSWLLSGHFDASISDIGVPLWAGACLAIWSGDTERLSMLDFVERSGVTHVDLPPSQLPALVARGFPAALETIIVGGEPAAPDALRAAASLLRVVNVYGPTETTVCASVEVVEPKRPDREPAERPSLGRPLPGVAFHVRGGELWISGWGVGLGYIEGRDEAFTTLADGRTPAYRTGDLVEALPDGTYLFLGRSDRQVQLRGQRLELGEIEQALLRAPGVTAAAAIYLESPAPHVVAFVALDAEASEAALENAAAALEAWKRPASIHVLDALPRLRNDKVDFKALHSLAASPSASGTAPSDPLATAWCRTLKRETAREDDDFFALGGDSVTALELSVEAARLGLGLEPEAIFDHPRLGDLRTALTRGVTVAELRSRSADAFRSLKLAVTENSSARERRGVLLTGATGMLGLQLLCSGDLEGRPVFALVRAKDDQHGAERLERLLGRQLPSELTVLRGDLGLPLLGLDEPALRKLTGCVGEVIHAAGAVDLVRSYASLKSVHVDGTGRVMELAARLGARLHHVSTLSIFVESDLPPGVIREDTELPPTARLFGGYAQTKWVADDLAQRYPLGGSVVRLGLLTAEAGAERPMDQLSRVIRGAAEIGAWPGDRDGCAFDVTPVRCAARLIARRLDDGTARPSKPVHLASQAPATGANLRAALAAEGFQLIEAATWPPARDRASQRLSAPGDRAVALAALTARAHAPAKGLDCGAQRTAPRSGDLFLATDHRFACPTVESCYPDALPEAPTHAVLRGLVRAAFGSAQRSLPQPMEARP